MCFFFQAEDGIRDLVRSRGLGDVYKRQVSRGARRMPNLRRRNKWPKQLRQSRLNVLHSILTTCSPKWTKTSNPLMPRDRRHCGNYSRNLMEAQMKKPETVVMHFVDVSYVTITGCLLYTSPSPRDRTRSRMQSSA